MPHLPFMIGHGAHYGLAATPATAGAQDSAKAPKNLKDTIEFREQCFLTDHMIDFAKFNKDFEYTSITRLLTNDPSTMLSELNSRKSIEAFFNILPHQVAALVPKIRLFKVAINEDDTTKSLIELDFNDSMSKKSIENITKTRFGRGDGIGIKSFEVETQGTNPAEGALVKCNMVIHFQNLEMLVDPGRPRGSNFLELILRRQKFEYKRTKDGKQIPGSRYFNDKYFKLMAVVGWAVPEGSLGRSNDLLKEALENCSRTIFLDLVDHTIDFQQDGSVNLSLDYQGAIQSIMNSPALDIFLLDIFDADEVLIENSERKSAEVKRHIEQSAKEEAKLKKEAEKETWWEKFNRRRTGRDRGRSAEERLGHFTKDNEAHQKELKSARRETAELKAKVRIKKYSRIISKLYERERIGHITLTPDQITAMMENPEERTMLAAPPVSNNQMVVGDNPDAPDIIKRKGDFVGYAIQRDMDPSSPTAVKAAGKISLGNKVPNNDPQDYRINFFYLGDLIEIVAEIFDTLRAEAWTELSVPEIHMMLGPFTYLVPLTETPEVINLADVPISLKLFEVWFNKNVVRPLRDSYPMKAFIKDVVTDLVLSALGAACYKGIGKRSNMVGLQGFIIPGKGDDSKTPRIPKGDVNLGTDIKANIFSSYIPIQPPPRKDFEDYQHYLLMYGANESPDHLDPSKVEEDFKKGIYHFILGSDSGLLKTVSFSKTDQPMLRPARLTTADAEERQLRDKYDASLEMIGNPFFVPGQKLYINPTLTGLGQVMSKHSITRELGLGGYYDVISILSTLDQSGYKTTVKCVWTTFGKDDDTPKKLASPQIKASSVSQPRTKAKPTTPKIEKPPVPPKSKKKKSKASPKPKVEHKSEALEKALKKKRKEEAARPDPPIPPQPKAAEKIKGSTRGPAPAPQPPPPPAPAPPPPREVDVGPEPEKPKCVDIATTAGHKATWRARLVSDLNRSEAALKEAKETGRSLSLRRALRLSAKNILRDFDANPDSLKVAICKHDDGREYIQYFPAG